MFDNIQVTVLSLVMSHTPNLPTSPVLPDHTHVPENLLLLLLLLRFSQRVNLVSTCPTIV